jgi:hypothetical protein
MDHLLADIHKNLSRWKKYLCHGGEPFVPEPSASEIELAIGKPKIYKSLGVD